MVTDTLTLTIQQTFQEMRLMVTDTLTLTIQQTFQEMRLMVTDTLTLTIQQTFRNDVFAQQAVTVDATNKAFRHAAYRQYVLWVYGRLQCDDRRTVPPCCMNVIRNKFPSADGHYTGFIPARHGVGW